MNIVRHKIECFGFPPHCTSDELKRDYVKRLKDQRSIELKADDIKKDPAGRYLNKIMANSVWGKWAQNPSSQCSLNTCRTLKEYHDKLLTGCVKRVSLISENLMQVELKNDRMIDYYYVPCFLHLSGLGGRNTIVGAFVTAAARDLMYCRYLSKLRPDTDSVSITNYVIEPHGQHLTENSQHTLVKREETQ